MGAAPSVHHHTSKWKVVQEKRDLLNDKDALRVHTIIRTELQRPTDGSDLPEDRERLKYHALNEVRRLRQRLAYATTEPERDKYVAHLTKSAAARSALKRNPEIVQRTEKFDQSRKEKALVRDFFF